MKPSRVTLQKIPTNVKKQTPMRLLATLCYHYPQYTLADARRLPYKHVVLLLETANKMEATRYYNMTNIAAAPHAKKGSVGKLLAAFKKVMK